MAKRVYVLGAGFTAQAGLPTLSNFFRQVKEKKNRTDTYEGKIEQDTFEKVLKLKEHNNQTHDMESAFTLISDEKFDVRKFGQGYTDREQLKRDFLYTVCRTLHLCWTDGRRDSRCLYRNFLKRVIEEQATLITFNYDLILDNLFFDMGLLPYYGFEVNERNTINFNSNSPGLRESGVTFLKMHGSQGWFKCNSCEREFAKIDVHDNWPSHRKGPKYSSGENCICCNTKTMDYLIVPPSVDKKGPEGKFLEAVWKIAECKIREAEEIVFIGYSFPKSDENIRETFKSLLERNIVLNSITVVDPQVENQNFKVPFYKVFKRKWAPREIHQFPQVPKCDITYIPKTFLCWFLEDFIPMRAEPIDGESTSLTNRST